MTLSTPKTTCISFFALAIAICCNLIDYYKIDLFCALLAIFALYKSKFDLKDFFKSCGLKVNKGNIFFLLFLVCISMAYLIKTDMEQKHWEAIASLRWAGIFYAFYFLGKSSRKSDSSKCILAIPILPSIVLVIVLANHYLKTRTLYSPLQRIQGFYENPNHLGLTLLLLWAFALALIFLRDLKNNRWNTTIFLIHIIVISIVIFGTYSRTTWIAMLMTMFAALYFTKSKRLFLSLIGLAVTLTFAVFLNLFSIQDRLLYSLDMKTEGSQYSRLAVWNVTWRVFLDNPIIGVGIEEIPNYYPSYYAKMGYGSTPIVGHAHNQFLEILAGSGVLGLAFYFAAFLSAYLYFLKIFRSTPNELTKVLSLSGILVVVALMSSSFTETPFRLHETRNYVLMFMGFLIGKLKEIQ